MRISAETPDDIDAIFALTQQAFQDHPHSQQTEGYIIDALRAAGALTLSLVAREDGSYLVAGWMPIDEFADQMGFNPGEDPEFETVAGLVLAELRRLPELGEHFTKNGWRFEVIDLDGRRIDKILLSRAE